jgi:hypothetical protein
LSAAQSATLFRETLASADQWPAFADEAIGSVDRDFSAPGNWVNVDMAAYDASGDLSVTASAAGQKASLPTFTTPFIAKRYYLQCDVANLIGGPFALHNSNGTLLGTIEQDGKFSCTFVVSDEPFGDLEVRSVASGSVDLDNFSLRPAGAVLDLSLEECSRYFVPDRSTNFIDAVLVSSGDVPDLLARRRGGLFVRGITDTNGSERLCGSVCLYPLYRISKIVIYNRNDASPVTSVDIGTSSGGSDIAAGVAISPGLNEVALAGHYAGTGELWITANGDSGLITKVFFDEAI